MKNSVQNNKSRDVAYPIYDLAEAIKVAEAVRDLGGGNVPVSRSLLAQQLKYAESGPSFFQRVAATKAFGLIDGWGSYSLTELAKQYFYPTVDNGKESAGIAALTFPNAFAVLVQKFDGGKLPPLSLIGNIIHKEAGIPVSKKDILAGCFVRSAQFLKAIDAGGFLRCKAFVAAGNRGAETQNNQAAPDDKRIPLEKLPKDFSDQEESYLFLDKDKTRKFTINSPLIITQAEYDRICKWIRVALIVDDDGNGKAE